MLTVKELRVLDADGNLAITLNTDDDLPSITLFGKPGFGSSVIYASNGDLILRSTDGTFACLWGGRLGICEITDEGFLDFIDP